MPFIDKSTVIRLSLANQIEVMEDRLGIVISPIFLVGTLFHTLGHVIGTIILAPLLFIKNPFAKQTY